MQSIHLYRVLHDNEYELLQDKGTLGTGEMITLSGDKALYSGKKAQDIDGGKYFFFSLGEAVHYMVICNRGYNNHETGRERFDSPILIVEVPIEIAKENFTGDLYSLGMGSAMVAETILRTEDIDKVIKKGCYQIVNGKENIDELRKESEKWFDLDYLKSGKVEGGIPEVLALAKLGMKVFDGEIKKGDCPETDIEIDNILSSLATKIKERTVVPEKFDKGLGI